MICRLPKAAFFGNMKAMRIIPLFALVALIPSFSAKAAIGITAPNDKTYSVSTSTTITVTADPAAVTTTATLDGAPFPVGVATVVSTFGYHELNAESRNASNVVLDSQTRRFNITSPERNGSENGLPPHTPYRIVNDAPSAFAGLNLQLVAPKAWPVGFPIPVAAKLLDGSGEGVGLNGVVTAGNFPAAPIQLRRGWGSVTAPAVATAGAKAYNAYCNGVSSSAPITFVSGTTWTDVTRLRIPASLSLPAGSTVNIGAGTIVACEAGVTITVQGTLNLNGTISDPIVFTPSFIGASTGAAWGGFHLNNGANSKVFAYGSMFVKTGAQADWFATGQPGAGFATHLDQQAAFAVGSTASAALTMEDCFLFDLAGQALAGNNATINLKRTLIQRCLTGGELNGSSSTSSIVTLDRSAIIEIPSETGTFVDNDNDGIYLTGGTHTLTKCVLGWTKDDGVDSGGNGATGTVTTMTGNWYDSVYHEGNSISGTRTINFTNCVFYNCGQGMELGYSGSVSAAGATTTVSNCLASSNQVGFRYGDNYNWDYAGFLTVKGSISLGNHFKDVWGMEWTSWNYRSDKMAIGDVTPGLTNPADRNVFSSAVALHPFNDALVPATHEAKIASFMPVPGSNVGVAISTYQAQQLDTAAYAGTFTVRLSTFSSKQVSVGWAVFAKTNATAAAETNLANGILNFLPGETVKTFTTSVPTPGNYGLIRVALGNPINAEVTGEQYYIKNTSAPTELISRSSTGWRYRETRSEPPAAWKTVGFDDSSPAATEWLAATLPAGFGVTVSTTVNGGSASDRTKAFYFRKKFTVADPSQYSGLTLNIRRDDAAVVWFNNEATPSMVTAESAFPGPYTYAMTGVPNSLGSGTYYQYSLPASKLVTGTNILAIELHQTSATSGDIVLDCDLLAAPPLELFTSNSGGQTLMWWFSPTDVLEHATDLGNWAPAPVTGSPVPLTTTKQREFFRLKR